MNVCFYFLIFVKIAVVKYLREMEWESPFKA